jgi:hypothetical protein
MPETVAPSVRYAEIHFGDNLRAIALREMGDAGRWVDLVLLNELRPPYIAEEAAFGVLAYGDPILVPSPTSGISADVDAAALFGADLLTNNKRLEVENGDFALVSGVTNLSQALGNRVMVGKRELEFHPEFGSHVRELIGKVTGPAAAQLAAFYVKSALLEDERVDTVQSVTATVVGDVISADAVVVPITGKPVDMRILI